MLKYLDIEPGAVSIMGLMNDKGHDVTLLIGEGWITFDMYHKKEHRERKTSSTETFSFRYSFFLSLLFKLRRQCCQFSA